MAVNLIDSSDITITQTGEDITLNLANVDDEVSTSSTNPIQNQAITNYVNNKSLDVYSTSETKIGIFMGKPLYRMTLESTTYATQYVFPTSNVEKIIRVDGMLQRSDYITIWQPIPGRLDNANFSSQFTTITNTGNLEVNLALGTSWSGAFRRIILYAEYTKTTD
jgi:hypothetical protein